MALNANLQNAYAFHVRRGTLGGPTAPNQGGGHKGEQVYIIAKDYPTAITVLQAVYGSDLSFYSGGAQLVQGAYTTMTGS